jgi:hypothetical protein
LLWHDAASRGREVGVAEAEEDRSGAATPRAIGSRARLTPPALAQCDACGGGMQPMGHCKWLCRRCGFLRTCIDTV